MEFTGLSSSTELALQRISYIRQGLVKVWHRQSTWHGTQVLNMTFYSDLHDLANVSDYRESCHHQSTVLNLCNNFHRTDLRTLYIQVVF